MYGLAGTLGRADAILSSSACSLQRICSLKRIVYECMHKYYQNERTLEPGTNAERNDNNNNKQASSSQHWHALSYRGCLLFQPFALAWYIFRSFSAHPLCQLHTHTRSLHIGTKPCCNNIRALAFFFISYNWHFAPLEMYD